MDSSKYEVLSRCLQAASGAVPADQEDSLYLVHEEGNQLIERLMEGSEPTEQDRIATGVKSKTPAAYLYKDTDERYVFCVDKSDTLKFYKYEGSWKAATLGSLPAQKLHTKGKLCATITPDGIVLYYQDPSGNLKGIEQRNGAWKALDTISVKTQDASPLSVSFSESDSNLYLYYVGSDASLHYRVISYKSGKSDDKVFPKSKFDKPITNFIVFRGEDGQGTEAYFLTPSISGNGSVFTRVDGDGTRATLGYARDGKFEPDSSAQCFRMCCCPIMVYYVHMHHMRRGCYCW